MMADVGEQKRRSEGFLGCEGGARVRSGSCGAASSKRVKVECGGGGGGSISAKVCDVPMFSLPFPLLKLVGNLNG